MKCRLNTTIHTVCLATISFVNIAKSQETTKEDAVIVENTDVAKKTEASLPYEKGKGEDNKKQKNKDNKAHLLEQWGLEIEGKIHSRWEMIHYKEDILQIDESGTAVVDEHGEPVYLQEDRVFNEFNIKRARLKLTWTPADWVYARLQLGDFQEFGEGTSLLKDAYIHLSPSKYLEVRVGLFKKPFSRLELKGSSALLVAERGIGNGVIVEQYATSSLNLVPNDDRLQYGDRDIGIQVSGRLIQSVKLDYEIGIFNGTGPVLTRKSNSKDAVLRITSTPSAWLKLGLNGSLKFFDKEEIKKAGFAGEKDSSFLQNPGWATGADVLFEAFGVALHLEALVALDYRVIDLNNSLIMNGIAILSYTKKFKAPWKFALEPVFKMEILDPSSIYINDVVLLYSPGLNLYFGKWVRLMLHGEIQRVSEFTAESLHKKKNGRSSEQFIAQFCFDI